MKSILDRLDQGDELHKEAAAYIRRLLKEHREEMREADYNAREAYAEGEWRGREEASEGTY